MSDKKDSMIWQSDHNTAPLDINTLTGIVMFVNSYEDEFNEMLIHGLFISHRLNLIRSCVLCRCLPAGTTYYVVISNITS